MATEPDIFGRSIVCLGRFNPAIFHPQWFARLGLLPASEADSATVRVVEPQICSFDVEWADCMVTLDQFQLSALRPEMEEPLRDLLVGTLRALPHTPVWTVGLNTDAHFRMASEDAWHALGHALSPKELWRDTLKSPGTAGVTIRGERPDDHRGAVNVRVEPSMRVHPGIYVNVNDHFELRSDGQLAEQAAWIGTDRSGTDAGWEEGAGPASELVEQHWSPSRLRAQEIVAAVTEIAK